MTSAKFAHHTPLGGSAARHKAAPYVGPSFTPGRAVIYAKVNRRNQR